MSWFTTADFGPKREAVKPLFKDIPDVKPLDWKYMAAGTVLLGAVGLGVGMTMGTYILVSAASVGGLIYVIESNKYANWLVSKFGSAIDIMIMAATILGTVYLGITAGVILIFTGLGFTIYLNYKRRK